MYRVISCALFEHEPFQLALAAGICAACFTAVALVAMHAEASRKARRGWIACMALIAGGGAWATHFVAMLAYRPPVAVGFEIGLTAVSLVIGVAGAWLAFFIREKRRDRLGTAASGAAFGSGVAALHFIGMASLRADAYRLWEFDLIVASWLLCVGFSLAAFQTLSKNKSLYRHLLACGFFVAAVISLHFTAMGALTLVPLALDVDLTGTLNGTGLAVMIGITVAGMLCVVALQAFAEQRVDLARMQNEAKSQFLASMSHELRTPLTSIIAYTEELAYSAAQDKRQADLRDANVILEASQHLLGLISDLMDYSKIQEGKFEIEPRTFPFAAFVDDIVAVSKPLAAKNENELVVELGSKLEMIDTDEARLRQCLLNLMSNAAKFTHGGLVRLRISDDWRGGARGVLFEVIDTGIGIDKEKQARIFERFRQADETVTRRYGGAGFGLSIVSEIAARLGGEVSVESEPGAGSCFSLWVLSNLRGLEAGASTLQNRADANEDERAAA